MALTTIDDRGLKTPIDLLDSEKIRFGTGNDIEIYHDATNSFITNTTGELKLTSDTIRLQSNTSNELFQWMTKDGTVQLYYDAVKKFETTSGGVLTTGNSYVNDDNKFIAGTGNDLQVYHDALNSYVKNSTGWLVLGDGGSGTVIKAATGENAIACTANGAVEIYHDNVLKLVTNSGGDYGSVECKAGKGSDWDGYSIGGYYAFLANNRGNADTVLIYNDLDNEVMFLGTRGGATELYYDGTKKLNTTSTGVVFQGNANVSDSSGYGGSADHFFSAGNSSDLKIYHHGAWGSSYINNSGSGALFVESQDLRFRKSDGNELYFQAVADGAVSLYYDNVKTLETGGDGITVLGPEGGNATLRLSADEGDDNADLWKLQAKAAGGIQLENYASGSWEDNIVAYGNGAVELYYDNAKKAETFGSGFKVSAGGELYIDGNAAGGHCEINMTRSDVSWGIANQSDFRLYRASGNDGNPAGGSLYLEVKNTSGDVLPGSNDSQDLGSSTKRWANIYTGDLNLSNEGSSNDVDSTWGNWTIQEGESDLFLKNNRSGKKYKFNLTEVS